MEDIYREVNSALRSAEAVIIGASNGLSISEGYNIFTDNEWFRKNFGDFREKYGIRSILQGMSADFSSDEEKWGFFSRLAYRVHYSWQPSRMMKELKELVKDKDCFVLTTNGEDHFTPVGFDVENVFTMEGKLTEYRCSNNCEDKIYSRHEDIVRMAMAEKDGMVPTDLLPRCPVCGTVMLPNLPSDQNFFKSNAWQNKLRQYRKFIDTYHGRALVILELGIGWRNQIIKAPLMELAAREDKCRYISFNKGELYIPEQIRDKSIGVDGDLSETIHAVHEAFIRS